MNRSDVKRGQNGPKLPVLSWRRGAESNRRIKVLQTSYRPINTFYLGWLFRFKVPVFEARP
jgi:hypothetical protein